MRSRKHSSCATLHVLNNWLKVLRSWNQKAHGKRVHCKKRLAIFPSPAGMSLTKLSLAGNILAGKEKSLTFFSVNAAERIFWLCRSKKSRNRTSIWHLRTVKRKIKLKIPFLSIILNVNKRRIEDMTNKKGLLFNWCSTYCTVLQAGSYSAAPPPPHGNIPT